MKKLTIVLTVLVLTAAMATGCGCRNSKPMPTTMPTVATTVPTTLPTTAPTTMPTTEPTTMPTIEDGNGPLSTDTTDTTEGMNSRSGRVGSGNGITGSITG